MNQTAKVLAVVIAVAGLIWIIPKPSCGCGSPDAELKSNLHGIHLAVERYKVDKGVYPGRIEALKTEGYMPKFPSNRYNRDDLTPREMQLVKPTALDGYAGNFNYEHITMPDGSAGYKLTLFGKDRRRWARDKQAASEHVMLELYSGIVDAKLGHR